MQILHMLMVPLLGGLIGYSTNWLAIKMLFKPHREKRIFGIRLPFTPGLIPNERERLTKKIAETVSANVLTQEVLTGELMDSSIWKLPADTLGEFLAKWDIVPAAVEQYICMALRNEGLRTGCLFAAEKGLQNLFVKTEGAFLDFTSGTLSKIIPRAKDWLDNNPVIDQTLSGMVRRIIDENFGRLIGIFIDHQKIYNNIKEGLFNYLSEPENQALLSAHILENAETGSKNGLEKLENYLSLLGETGLPAPAHKALNDFCEMVFAFPIHDYMKEFLSKEKNASLFKRMLENTAGYIAKNIPIQSMIEKKMNQFSIEESEQLILSVVGRELRVITALGGVLGFMIGLVSLFF